LADHVTNEPYHVSGDVYLRGAVLTRYRDGQWECEGWGPRSERGPPGRATLPSKHGLVRQTVRIRPMDRNELFCVWPFVVLRASGRLQYDAHCERLYRLPSSRGEEFTFRLGTTAFLNGKQAEFTPAQRGIDPQFFLQTPVGAVPRLMALADEWIEASGIPADDQLSRVLLLEERLRNSGQFRYSLEGRERDATLDPIEDFVVNHSSGNCEYFATALTLMLRSQGVPARMVVGYKCDEYDYQGRFYQVRQLHAHSWVEAYLAREQLPDRLPEGPLLDWSGGGWLRLDPTPTVSGGLVAVNRLMAGVESWIQWLDFAWANYVIGMNGGRQRELIYGRLVALLRQTGQRLVSVDWWSELFRKAGRSLSQGARRWTDDPWALLWSVLAALVIVLLLVFGYGRLRSGGLRLRVRFPRRVSSKERGDGASVGFYRRLEALLARQGLARAPTQTQREFACQAGAAIAQATGERGLARLPTQVAEAFYCVRFGDARLDRAQTETVAQALHLLEQATNGRRRTGRQIPAAVPPTTA
jgi:transglutaminase-like putative cysteine protease